MLTNNQTIYQVHNWEGNINMYQSDQQNETQTGLFSRKRRRTTLHYLKKKRGTPPPKGLQKRRDCNTPQNKTLSTLLKNATGPKLDQTPETQTGLAEITNL